MATMIGQGLKMISSHLEGPFFSVVPTRIREIRPGQEEKPKVKKAKKVLIYSSDREKDESSEIVAPTQPVMVFKRKIDCALPPPPQPPSPKAIKKLSSSCSLSTSLALGSCTKWRCGRCKGRSESKEEYYEHKNICRRVLAQSRKHGVGLVPDFSVSSRIRLVSIRPSAQKDDGGEKRDFVAEYLPKLVSCSVCGDRFGSMAVLNFHVKKKHNGSRGEVL